MIIIGERINATRKSIARALEERDAEHIARTALEQAEAGADYLDVNGGDPRMGKEADNMTWLIELVQANTDLPVAVDTANPEAARRGLSMAKKKPLLNSISLESERISAMLPLLGEFDCMVVALLMDDNGTPCDVDGRLKRARALIKKITGAGRKIEEIVVDPCFLPVSTDPANGRTVIEAIAKIHREWPEVHIGGGCSNISFGLPKRKYINFALLSQAIYNGMDTGIIDPCTPGIMATILAAEAVAGKDDFCMNYVTRMR
ncbi:MAG: dihydropteroate synthase [Planctomycetota bacterium]|jgi:5-methyltetrahydrofolate--homocysteine methyltransferase